MEILERWIINFQSRVSYQFGRDNDWQHENPLLRLEKRWSGQRRCWTTWSEFNHRSDCSWIARSLRLIESSTSRASESAYCDRSWQKTWNSSMSHCTSYKMSMDSVCPRLLRGPWKVQRKYCHGCYRYDRGERVDAKDGNWVVHSSGCNSRCRLSSTTEVQQKSTKSKIGDHDPWYYGKFFQRIDRIRRTWWCIIEDVEWQDIQRLYVRPRNLWGPYVKGLWCSSKCHRFPWRGIWAYICWLFHLSIKRKQITIRGYCTEQDELKEMFHQSDLVALPSRTEGFGLVALEAISAGVPVLVSGESGIAEALQQVKGGNTVIVGSDEDEDEWARRIRKMYEESAEEREANAVKLRENYRKVYSWKAECERFKGLIENVVKTANGESTSFNFSFCSVH